jgi:hypothetical protein
MKKSQAKKITITISPELYSLIHQSTGIKTIDVLNKIFTSDELIKIIEESWTKHNMNNAKIDTEALCSQLNRILD